MLLHTHLLLSRLIRQGIQSHTKIKLDSKSFAFGNIKPDIVRDFYIPQIDDDRVMVAHYIDDAFHYVCTLIDELIETPHLNSNGPSRLFSMKLGVIMHYISDFFCHAHSSKFVDSPLAHHLYEWQFANHLGTNSKVYMDMRKIGLMPIYNDFYDIVASIHDIQIQYLSKSPSYSLDAQYALKCCIATAVSIIQICTNKDEKIAA